MSIHSAEDFDPSSSTPVFGSAVSQTKLQQQQQPTNDLGGSEKLVTPPETTVNGQNDTSNHINSDNLGNGTTQSVNGNTSTTESTDVHVNGENKKSDSQTLSSTDTTVVNSVNSSDESASASGTLNPVEKTNPNDSLPASLSSNEPTTDNVTSTVVDPPAPIDSEPALSTSADVAQEELKSKVPTNAPPVPVLSNEPTTTSTSNEDVPASATAPEATVLAESATPDRKSKVIESFSFYY